MKKNTSGKVSKSILYIASFLFISTGFFNSPHALAISSVWKQQGPFGLTYTLPSTRSTNEVLVVSPTASSTVYVGTKGGGIFKTINGGDTWQTINAGITACEGGTITGWGRGASTKQVTSLAIDPNTPTTLWAGVWCGEGEMHSFKGLLYKSTDGGATWALMRSEPGYNQMYYGIRVSPSNSNTVYFIRAQNRVDRTTDGGTTFITGTGAGLPTNNGSSEYRLVLDIIVNPTASSTLYSLITRGTGFSNATTTAGVFKSTDAGNTWSSMNGDMTIANGFRPGALKMAGTNPNIFYFSFSGLDGLNYLMRTSNGGTNWVVASSSSTWSLGGGYFVGSLNIDPITTTTLYATTEDTLQKSTDSGATWTKVGDIGTNSSIGERLAQPIIQAPSDQNVFYLMAIDSIYRSNNGGATWLRKDTGLANLTVRYMTVHPTDPKILYAISVNPDRLYKSTDSGLTWTEVNSSIFRNISSGFTENYNYTDRIFLTGSTVYMKCYCVIAGNPGFGIVRSTDHGVTWSSVPTPNAEMPFAFEYSLGNNTLYITTGHGRFYKSSNGGTTWTAGVSVPVSFPTKIAVSQSNTNNVYVWSQFSSPHARSIDGGATFATTTGVIMNSLAIATSTLTSTTPTLYTDAGSTVRKSVDGGATWTLLTGWPAAVPAPLINFVTIDPLNSNALFASSFGQGLFVSTNAGGTWSQLNTGLGNSYIESLTVNPTNTSIIWGATRGSSVWEDPVIYGTLPTISSISPATPTVGSILTINGTGFGDTQGAGSITIVGVSYTPISWSDTQVSVDLTNVTPGDNYLVVNHDSGEGTLMYDFTVADLTPKQLKKLEKQNKK